MFVSVVLVAAPYLTDIKWDLKLPAAYVGKTVLNNPKVSEKVVALTFDDGPSPITTPPILDALHRYKARSTFFIVGQMASKRKAILRRMVAEGHVVGNHTFSHPYHPPGAKAKFELQATNLIIHQAVGYYPTVFRPPGGVMDSWTARLAKSHGLASVIWTGSSADTSTTSADVVYANVINASHPGAIILMHDVKPHTAAAVPRILATLKARGFRFVTVPEMLKIWSESKQKAEQEKLASNPVRQSAG